jgi:membrane-associated phospholipid phosphatase
VLIALGRVYASAHYTSDILAGAGVGLLSGLTIAPWVSRRFARRQPREAAQPHDPAARKAHQSDERAAAGD